MSQRNLQIQRVKSWTLSTSTHMFLLMNFLSYLMTLHIHLVMKAVYLGVTLSQLFSIIGACWNHLGTRLKNTILERWFSNFIMQINHLLKGSIWSNGSGWDLRFCISNKLPEEAGAAGPRTTLWVAKVRVPHCISPGWCPAFKWRKLSWIWKQISKDSACCKILLFFGADSMY